MIRALVLALVIVISGCHTMNIEVTDQDHVNVVNERKSFFFWGLTPTKKVDVSQHCPNGVTAIRESTLFVDGVFELITLGIWSPRSSIYFCAGEK